MCSDNTQRAAKIKKGRQPTTHVGLGLRHVSGVSLNSMSSQAATTSAHTASHTHTGSYPLPHVHTVEDPQPYQLAGLNEGPTDRESPVPVEGALPLFGLTTDANLSTNNSPTNIPPDNVTDNAVPTKSRRGTKQGSLIYTIYENISNSLGEAGALLLSSSGSSHILPAKLDTFSIDDIEAETFKASVRIKPSPTRHSSGGKALTNVLDPPTSPAVGANAVTATVTELTIVDS